MKKPETLLVSVSGGRTSGYMARWVQENHEAARQLLGVDSLNVVYAFANTGMEHEDTLRFLNDMDREFGLGIVWLEGEPHLNQRKSTTHRITNYDDAFRYNQWLDPRHPFHAHITKYGVPNVKFKSCTREMKRNTINSYMKTVADSWWTAIGIREDEQRRVSKNAGVENIVYPLVDWWPVDKEEILEWWEDYSWDLRIPEYLGNCITCYKKSFKKLKFAHEEMPEAFEFNRSMENKYGLIGPEFKKYEDARARTFFRMNMGTSDLIRYFEAVGEPEEFHTPSEGGCSESCEMYEME